MSEIGRVNKIGSVNREEMEPKEGDHEYGFVTMEKRKNKEKEVKKRRLN